MLKKTIRSIRKFVKAFTTSRRSSRNERKAKQWKEEQSEEQSGLIQEDHSEQNVTDNTSSSQVVHTVARRCETGSSEANNGQISQACQLAVQQFLNLDLWAPEFTPIRSSPSSEERSEPANIDPFIGHDPFSPANGCFSHCDEGVTLAANDPFAGQDPFASLNNTEDEENWAFFGDSTDNPNTTIVSEADPDTGSFLDWDDRIVVATNNPFVVQDMFSPADNTGPLLEECTALDLQQDNNSSLELSLSMESMAVSSTDDTEVTVGNDFISQRSNECTACDLQQDNSSLELSLSTESMAASSTDDTEVTVENDFISESSPVDTYTSYSVTNEGESNEPADAEVVVKHKLNEEEFMIQVLSQRIIMESEHHSKSKDAVVGHVAVSSDSCPKRVFARATTDSWKTYTDICATYISSSYDHSIDRFSFDFPHGEIVEFALCMEADGTSYWNNNNGNNYILKQ